jgi:hypothetical protein
MSKPQMALILAVIGLSVAITLIIQRRFMMKSAQNTAEAQRQDAR